MRTFSVSSRAVSEIFRHFISELPNESCGYLAGSVCHGEIFIPMTNRYHSPIKFAFDPKEQFEAVRLARSKGFDLIGTVHSHPGGTAYPSSEDCEWADPALVHIIAVPESGQIRAFKIKELQPEELKLFFIDTESPSGEDVSQTASQS